MSMNYVSYKTKALPWSDYYPFGLVKDGRSNESSSYRFGFQGQERDDEIAGEGTSWSFKYRTHNARYGRFFSVDPLTASYPFNSPFAFSENDVIRAVELEGAEKRIVIFEKIDGNWSIISHELPKVGPLGADIIAFRVNIEGKTRLMFGRDKESLEEIMHSQEGKHSQVYLDSKGLETIGIGHLLKGDDFQKYSDYYNKSIKPDIKNRKSLSEDEISQLFQDDYNIHSTGTLSFIEQAYLDQMNSSQKDAIVDAGFNMGIGVGKRFNNFLKEKGNSISNGESWFLRYMTKKALNNNPGVVKRRVGNYMLYSEGEYMFVDMAYGKTKNTLEQVYQRYLQTRSVSELKPNGIQQTK